MLLYALIYKGYKIEKRLGSGPKGRRLKSCHLDHRNPYKSAVCEKANCRFWYKKEKWGKYWGKVGKTIYKGGRCVRSPLSICPDIGQRFQKIATMKYRVARCLIGGVAACLWLASWAKGDGGVQGFEVAELLGGRLLGTQ